MSRWHPTVDVRIGGGKSIQTHSEVGGFVGFTGDVGETGESGTRLHLRMGGSLLGFRGDLGNEQTANLSDTVSDYPRQGSQVAWSAAHTRLDTRYNYGYLVAIENGVTTDVVERLSMGVFVQGGIGQFLKEWQRERTNFFFQYDDLRYRSDAFDFNLRNSSVGEKWENAARFVLSLPVIWDVNDVLSLGAYGGGGFTMTSSRSGFGLLAGAIVASTF